MPRKLCDPLRFYLVVAACAGLLCFPLVGLASPPQEEPTEAKLRELVEQLGADSYVVRDNAQRQLLNAGNKARPFLEMGKASDDVERRLRCEHILQELRRDEIWKPSTVSLSGKQIPVLEAFKEISTQTGNPVNWDLTPKSLIRNVDIGWEGETYWHAMDELSKQADVVPRFYDDPKRAGVVLTHGYINSGPVDYVGPLRGSLLYCRHLQSETLNFGDRVPDHQESLEMTMALHWEQRFALSRYGQPEILEAITDQEENLVSDRKKPSTMMPVSRRQRQLVFSFRLKPPEKSAKKLKTLRLSVPLVAAGDFIGLEVPAEPGALAQKHGYTFAMSEASTDDKMTRIVLNWARPYRYDKSNATDMVDEYLEVVDASGQLLPFHQQRVLGGPSHAQYTIQVPLKAGKPSRLRYHAATLRSEKKQEFVFNDVPLPSTIE